MISQKLKLIYQLLIKKSMSIGERGRWKTQSRYFVQRDLNKELELFNKENAPYYFEKKYNAEVFDPAMKARREKLKNYRLSDFDDIRAEKRAVLENIKKNTP